MAKNASSTPADSNAASTDAAPKRTRSSRSNNGVTVQITDPTSAQQFVDQALTVTANDVPNAQFNQNGFVTPARVDTIPVQGCLRMIATLINSLATRVSETAEGKEASAALGVINAYAGNVGLTRHLQSTFNSLLSAARILHPNFKGSDVELVNLSLKPQNKTWEQVSEGIRREMAPSK